MLAFLQLRALQHVLGRAVGAGDRTQFDVAPAAVHRKHLRRRQLDELGERAVEVGAHPEVLHRAESVRPHAGPHQHPRADQRGGTAGSDRDDATAAVRTLDERERGSRIPAAVGLVARAGVLLCCGAGGVGAHALGIPAQAGVDLGVVDAGRQHLYQHLAGREAWQRDVAVDQPVVAAVAGGHDRLHGRAAGREVETVRHRHGAAAQSTSASLRSPSRSRWIGSTRPYSWRVRSGLPTMPGSST